MKIAEPITWAEVCERGAIKPWPTTARLLGLSRNAVYAGIMRGEIPSLKVGKRIVVPVPLLRAMLGDSGAGER